VAAKITRSNSFRDPMDESDYTELTKGLLELLTSKKDKVNANELAVEVKSLVQKQLQSRKDSRLNKLSPNQLNSLQGNTHLVR